MNRRALKLVICIAAETVRRKFLKLLHGLAATGELERQIPHYRFELARCTSRQQARDYLCRHLHSGSDRAAILLSDMVADGVADPTQTDSWQPSHWAKELHCEFPIQLATIGILDRPRRVRDLDRVVGPRAGAQPLLDCLQLVTAKLSYLSPPEQKLLVQPVEVRLVRKQHELMEYFQLRHRIYKIMGYLEEEIEDAPSQMEIDWCDTIALHIGAYEQMRHQRERLVGAARIVISTPPAAGQRHGLLADYQRWTTQLASQDERLRNVLNNRVLGLELPIFHSLHLREVFREVVLRNEVCGELSRVIVAEDYRGAGLSRRLVEFALAQATQCGVQRMFLECLEVHAPLYCRFGFQGLPASPGAVIGVNQTMVGMELSPLVAGAARAAAAASDNR